MALSLFRLGRFIRSIFAPAAAIVGFSCLLTFIFVLYQPTPGPGNLQRLGWQSWDIISDVSTTGDGVSTGGDLSSPVGGGDDEPVDWWNVTTSQPQTVDSASLPLDVWDPTLPHDTGLSEIEITQCWIDPFFAPSIAQDICFPPSTKDQDAIKGKWVRVERNINAQAWGMMSLNIYYRRTRRHDVPLVTDVRILPERETPSPFSPSWRKVSHAVSPSGEKLYLWYKAESTWLELTAQQRQEELVTEFDVLFGDDRPWYGFEKLSQPVVTGNPSLLRESVWITYRRGVHPVPRAPPLHFSHDGRFKIMQIADLHFSVSAGNCRDTDLSPCDASDNLTSTLLGRMLDAENPDFVVFSGDQLNGQGTAWDARSVLAKFSRSVADRGIPWAAVYGNHDSEDGESREAQLKYMQGLPYSMVQPGPKDIHGVGNYVLKVMSADASKTHLLTLYFLDSGSYAQGFFDWFGFFVPTEYDWIHQDQIDWFLQESASISAIERPFTPDSGSDFGDLWKRQDGTQLTPTTRRLVKPNALMFFHIPLQEAYSAADINSNTGATLDVGEHDIEAPGNAKKQDGFFHKGVLQAMESEHRAGGNLHEVKVIANGHCHVTENCRRVKGVWMCFGGGGSYSGYGRVGFDRRVRIYDVSDFGETIRTYKRTEHDGIVDNMALVGKGAPPAYAGA